MQGLLERRRRYQQAHAEVGGLVSPPVRAPEGVTPTETMVFQGDTLTNQRFQVDTSLIQLTQEDRHRRAIRFRNVGTTTLYLGGSGMSSDSSVVRLLPNDIWVDEIAAGAAWYAVSSAAGGLLAMEKVT